MKRWLLFVAALACFFNGIACTTFFINKNGQMVFGRNYDWITETGVVNTNLRGLIKNSFEFEKGKSFQWTSKYGSITFNQYGKEFPTGGMNEKGLVVELMWLDQSEFPSEDQRPALGVLQWIQYQLDNCSTIDEVIATDKNVRINPHGAPQHYLVADANGNAATIEFLNGKLVAHKGSSLPYSVLANNTYEESLLSIKKPDTEKDNSLQRFGTACKMVTQLQESKTDKPIVESSFDILNSVSQGSFTKWSIVYDITNKKIHFKTANYSDIKILDFKSFDLSCTAKPMSFVMNQKGSGEISKSFVAYSNEVNKAKLTQAFIDSKDRIEVSEKEINAMAELAANVKCKQ